MYAKDNKIKLQDQNIVDGNHNSQIFFEWSKVFSGATRYEFDKSPRAFLKKYFDLMLD